MWIFGKNNKQVEKQEDYVDLTHLNNFDRKEESNYIKSFYGSHELGPFGDDDTSAIPYGYIDVYIQLNEDSELQKFLVKTELYSFVKQEYTSTSTWSLGNSGIPKKEYEAIIELLAKNEATFHVHSLDIQVGYDELKKLVKDGKIPFSEYLDSMDNPLEGGDSSEDSLTDVLVKQQKED